jgi:hypothetical protein
MHKRLKPAVVATIVAAGLVGAGASPASASYYGNAYLVVGNWNCIGGGSVVGVGGAVDNVWSGGDWGDNIIYPRVRVGDTNTFNGWAYCSRPWWRGGDYRINVIWKQFRPTGNNQTFWF